MSIFSCPDASDDDVGRSYDCFKHAPTNLLTCTEVIAAWAVGGNVRILYKYYCFFLWDFLFLFCFVLFCLLVCLFDFFFVIFPCCL